MTRIFQIGAAARLVASVAGRSRPAAPELASLPTDSAQRVARLLLSHRVGQWRDYREHLKRRRDHSAYIARYSENLLRAASGCQTIEALADDAIDQGRMPITNVERSALIAALKRECR